MPHPAGPSATVKSASLSKGEIPKQTIESPPPASKTGVDSLYNGK